MRESDSKTINVPSPEAMHKLGVQIGRALLSNRDYPQCVAIEGDLGAGKTTLVAGVIEACGVEGPVRSPTYTLVEPYETAGRFIYHMDLYRLTDPAEIEPLGVREMLAPGSILLIEWPSRAQGHLPAPDLQIGITYLDPPEAGREVRLSARSPGTPDALQRLLR